MYAVTISSEVPATRILTRTHIRNVPRLHFSKPVKLQSRITTESKTISMKSSISVRNEGVVREEHSVGDKDAVIIVDHGSRRQESNLMLNEFVAMFKGRTGYGIVEPAHMSKNNFFNNTRNWLNHQSRMHSSCVCNREQNGLLSVLFSSLQGDIGSRFIHQDIPSLAAEAAKDHPGISYLVTAPLGLHELMVDVMNDRIKHCLSHVAGDAGECDVCAGTDKCRLY